MRPLSTSAYPIRKTIFAGKKINYDVAKAAHHRYQAAVCNGDLLSVHCPEIVAYSLDRVEHYIKDTESELARLGIPSRERGLAILPVQSDPGARVNFLLTPCVVDLQGRCVHQYLLHSSRGREYYEWLLDGLGGGRGWPEEG